MFIVRVSINKHSFGLYYSETSVLDTLRHIRVISFQGANYTICSLGHI